MEEGKKILPMTFGRIHIPTGTTDWWYLSHQSYDGLGGVLHLMREFGPDVDISYNFTPRQPLTLRQKWNALKEYIPESQLRKTNWNQYIRELPLTEAPKWYVLLSEEEMNQLSSLAKAQRSSVQAYILYRLDHFISHELMNEKERWWMIPFSMRTKNQVFSTQNHTSYFGVALKSEDTPRSVQQKMIDRIKANTAWAAWFWLEFLAFFGKGLIRVAEQYYDKNEHTWTGTFTFLDYHSDQPDYHWFGIAPITKAHPVACNVVKRKKSLVIATQIHPGIVSSQMKWEELMQKFKSSLLGYT